MKSQGIIVVKFNGHGCLYHILWQSSNSFESGPKWWNDGASMAKTADIVRVILGSRMQGKPLTISQERTESLFVTILSVTCSTESPQNTKMSPQQCLS